MNHQLSTQEKKKILDFVANEFSQVATAQNWVSHYDKDSDSFVLRAPEIQNTKKRYINDEFAFYLDDKSNVKGLFIEYFTTNLISHNEKNLGEIRTSIQEQEKTSKESIIELKKIDSRKLVSGLEEIMLNSMIQRMPIA